MNLFIDTNIFLNFYHFSKDDLEELNKLSVTIQDSKVELFLPEHVKHEFHRNRDSKINNALKEFKKERIENTFPHMTKHYEEYKKLKDYQKAFIRDKNALLQKLESDIHNNNLLADKVINELFNKAKFIPLTDKIYKRAMRRHVLRHPPGKEDSHGDALNWESLLEGLERNESLVIITDDGDYISAFENGKINSFLCSEWRDKKNAEVTLYDNLSSFFKDKFPDIKLSEEQEKNSLIQELFISETFANTDLTLSKLVKFTSLSKAQVNSILSACINNSRIYYFSDNKKMLADLTTIINNNLDNIDTKIFEKFKEVYEGISVQILS